MIDQTEFRTLLTERRLDLARRLVTLETSLNAPRSRDSEEHAIEVENDEVMEGLGRGGLAELRRIDDALHRIDAGDYGVCLRCGEPISAERLRVVPDAVLCRGCVLTT